MPHKNKKIHTILTLGAGAARGFAHVGVLRCLEQEKIPIDMIIGVSMGAIVGSIYSVIPEADYVENRLIKLIHSAKFIDTPIGQWTLMLHEEKKNILKRFNRVFFQTEMLGKMATKKSLVSANEYEGFLTPYIPNTNIEDTRIKFGAVGVNIDTAATRLFTRGSLRSAVLASAAMPFMLPPKDINGKKYVDGGVLDKMGIDSARRLKPKNIITVDLSGDNFDTDPIINSIDVLIRTIDIASYHRRKEQLKKVDILISPIQSDLHWADYNAYREFINMGYEETCKKINCIREKLKLNSFWKRIFIF